MIGNNIKFPIGNFEKPAIITKEILSKWISEIILFPEKLIIEVGILTQEQLDTQYRPDGWTIRQVVHHCADSHINSFIRFKLALTEDSPIIKPYFEELWAELIDSKNFPIDSSIKILVGVHERWGVLLNNLTNNELEKVFIHPEHNRKIRLDENIGVYAWHCSHHLAHITTLKQSKGWK